MAAIIIPNTQRESLSTQLRGPSMTPLEAEKRLMLAVLERAVDDFRTYAVVPTGRGRWLFMEAAAWFQSFATGAFDFEGICEATGLDPDFIRKRLRRWYDVHCPQRPVHIERMRRRAMGQDHSWDRSARQYEELYLAAYARRRGYLFVAEPEIRLPTPAAPKPSPPRVAFGRPVERLPLPARHARSAVDRRRA